MSDKKNNIHSINDAKKAKNSQQQNGGKVPLDISETTVMTCECGSRTFIVANVIGKLSPAHPKNATGKPNFVPFPIYVCAACGEEAHFE